jgi:hypothetical protein
LVLEAVAPAEATTARVTTNAPETVAPGVELADAGSATNRMLVRVPPADLEKTVLMKDVKSTATESPKSP